MLDANQVVLARPCQLVQFGSTYEPLPPRKDIEQERFYAEYTDNWGDSVTLSASKDVQEHTALHTQSGDAKNATILTVYQRSRFIPHVRVLTMVQHGRGSNGLQLAHSALAPHLQDNFAETLFEEIYNDLCNSNGRLSDITKGKIRFWTPPGYDADEIIKRAEDCFEPHERVNWFSMLSFQRLRSSGDVTKIESLNALLLRLPQTRHHEEKRKHLQTLKSKVQEAIQLTEIVEGAVEHRVKLLELQRTIESSVEYHLETTLEPLLHFGVINHHCYLYHRLASGTELPAAVNYVDYLREALHRPAFIDLLRRIGAEGSTITLAQGYEEYVRTKLAIFDQIRIALESKLTLLKQFNTVWDTFFARVSGVLMGDIFLGEAFHLFTTWSKMKKLLHSIDYMQDFLLPGNKQLLLSTPGGKNLSEVITTGAKGHEGLELFVDYIEKAKNGIRDELRPIIKKYESLKAIFSKGQSDAESIDLSTSTISEEDDAFYIFDDEPTIESSQIDETTVSLRDIWEDVRQEVQLEESPTIEQMGAFMNAYAEKCKKYDYSPTCIKDFKNAQLAYEKELKGFEVKNYGQKIKETFDMLRISAPDVDLNSIDGIKVVLRTYPQISLFLVYSNMEIKNIIASSLGITSTEKSPGIKGVKEWIWQLLDIMQIMNEATIRDFEAIDRFHNLTGTPWQEMVKPTLRVNFLAENCFRQLPEGNIVTMPTE